MRHQPAHPDAVVARIAARQHGVVSIEQLVAAGFSKYTVRRREQAGQLHRIHRGVYAVGHPCLSREGRWMAAILACGEGAVLSHASAAALWDMVPAQSGAVDVTIPTASGRSKRRGIRLHRSRSLPNAATTHRERIAVTTPTRTLADLRRALAPEQFRKAVRQAEFLGLDLRTIRTDGTRSEAEGLFLRICRRHRIVRPEVNARIGRYTVDFLWPEQRLVVETDGYVAHRGKQAFEDDRARELDLHALGYRVRRFTYRQVRDRPRTVARAVRAELAG